MQFNLRPIESLKDWPRYVEDTYKFADAAITSNYKSLYLRICAQELLLNAWEHKGQLRQWKRTQEMAHKRQDMEIKRDRKQKENLAKIDEQRKRLENRQKELENKRENLKPQQRSAKPSSHPV